jgi:hypothetical protein
MAGQKRGLFPRAKESDARESFCVGKERGRAYHHVRSTLARFVVHMPRRGARRLSCPRAGSARDTGQQHVDVIVVESSGHRMVDNLSGHDAAGQRLAAQDDRRACDPAKALAGRRTRIFAVKDGVGATATLLDAGGRVTWTRRNGWSVVGRADRRAGVVQGNQLA